MKFSYLICNLLRVPGVTIKLSSHTTFFFIVLTTRLMFDLVETGGRPFVFPLATLGDGQMLECNGILDGVDVVQSCIYC